jgi:GH24 family phage-related lysozyme (muramidase)
MIYFGVVEERCSDPLKVGRCKVRVLGVHTENRQELPTDDLPWAFPVTTVNSASFSGVGHSPTGLIEGSWVLIVFGDEFKQQPLIIGSLPGIPTTESIYKKPQLVDKPIVLTDRDNNTVTDSEGNPILTGSSEPISETDAGNVKDPGEMILSADGRRFIHGIESLASLERDRVRIARVGDSIPDSTPIYSYRDSVGLWTIGWGSRFLKDGTPVSSGTILTKKQCDELFDIKVKTEFESGLKKNLRVPVTQSMYDALVSMAYNMGVSGLTNSDMFKELNAGRYEIAAALIPTTRAKGLANRRASEQKFFLAQGIPTKDGMSVEPAPSKTLERAEEQAKATGKPIGSSSMTTNSSPGFSDSSGKYPRFKDEQDVHRLSRRESESATILKLKEAARVKNVKLPKDREWTQPKIPYAASYPFNHTRMSESGHLFEVDDTKDAERIHEYHRSGTYREVDSNGTTVNRIVGDDYHITERNGYLLVKGNVAITVVGDADIRIENDCNLDVVGNMNTKVAGEYTLSVKKDIKIKAEGAFKMETLGAASIEAPNILLNCDVPVNIPILKEIALGRVEFSPLTTISRNSELNAAYETPEEGNPAAFKAKHAHKFDDEDNVPAGIAEESTKPTEKTPVASTVECENLRDSDIVPSYRLSPLFTLGDLLSRGKSGYPSGLNYGMTSSHIVCNLKNLAVNCLDKIKAKYPNMIITSAWRSQAYNAHIGGSKKSDHLSGCAADIQLNGFTRRQYYEAVIDIQRMLPAFKQLILEYRGGTTWIHVAYKDGANSNQCLTIDAATNTTLSVNSFVLVK